MTTYTDLIFPDPRSRLFWRIKTRLALLQADRLVTVSEDARRQISDVFGYAPETIAVVTEGANPLFKPLDDPKRVADVRVRLQLPPEAPLLLYVGGISPHKNLQGLFRALVDVPGAWHAVLTGDYEHDSFWGCYEELVHLGQELGLSDRIHFTGFVTDDDLHLLYNAATLLVLPSISEGFGLPVVEAMACGLPVIASARNSIPEVLGDAGILIDPEAPVEMTEAMTRVLESRELQIRLGHKGRARAELFNWENGAQRMMRVLEDAYQG